MSFSARCLLLMFLVFPPAFFSVSVASETSKSAKPSQSARMQRTQPMPTPEAVELEQPGVRYQFAIVRGSVQVTCYVAEKRAASVRVLVESVTGPELLEDKANWVQQGNGAEWSLSSPAGRLALTAIAGRESSTPSDTVLRFEGAKSLALDALGNLLVVTDAGDLHQQRPAVFNSNGAPVAARYVLLGGNRVAVEVWTQHPNVVNGMDAMWSSGLEFGYGH